MGQNQHLERANINLPADQVDVCIGQLEEIMTVWIEIVSVREIVWTLNAMQAVFSSCIISIFFSGRCWLVWVECVKILI